MKKIRNRKGFTLAELLIVVAIIAVLVAIAIPIFTTQLEKSREATDFANARAAYAQISAAALTEDPAPANTSNITYNRTGSEGAYVYTAVVKLTQKEDGWKTTAPAPATAVAGVTSTGSPSAGGNVTITVTEATGVCTIVWA